MGLGRWGWGGFVCDAGGGGGGTGRVVGERTRKVFLGQCAYVGWWHLVVIKEGGGVKGRVGTVIIY